MSGDKSIVVDEDLTLKEFFVGEHIMLQKFVEWYRKQQLTDGYFPDKLELSDWYERYENFCLDAEEDK